MQDRIRDLFGFTPPDDFQFFWEFATATKRSAPQHAFNDLTMISLVGPFDLLAGRFDKEKANFEPCLHWRYFGDPPEFVTILTGGTDGLHWGYVVDRPSEVPLGIAGFYAHDDVSLFLESPSPFGVLRNSIESNLESIEEDAQYAPESANDPVTIRHKENCEKLLDSIETFCSKHNLDLPEPEDLDFIDHCNPPPPFSFPEPKDFPKLPKLIESGLKKLKSQGLSDLDARLRIGRMLWHWHYDGNSLIEQAAFNLLDEAYEFQKNDFLQHVLEEHRKHRHRKSLDVFDT